MEGLVGRRAGLVRAKASREPPREGWCWPGDWRRSGGLSSLAVAAVSRDTMRSFSPPAATPVTVSVTATLLLAAGGSHGRGSSDGGAQRLDQVSEGLQRALAVFSSVGTFALGPQTPSPRRRPLEPPQAGRSPPVDISGGRATSCGNGASRGQNATEDVLRVRKLLT